MWASRTCNIKGELRDKYRQQQQIFMSLYSILEYFSGAILPAVRNDFIFSIIRNLQTLFLNFCSCTREHWVWFHAQKCALSTLWLTAMFQTILKIFLCSKCPSVIRWNRTAPRRTEDGKSLSWASGPLTAAHNVSHYNVIQAPVAKALNWPRSELFMGCPSGKPTREETQLKEAGLGSTKCCSVRPVVGSFCQVVKSTIPKSWLTYDRITALLSAALPGEVAIVVI